MEVVGHDRKRVLWELFYDHAVEDPNDNYEIGLWGFDFNFFDEDKKGVGR